MGKSDVSASKEIVVFRVHGSAMEPCFYDGEFLEVNFGRELDYESGGVGGRAARGIG